MDRLAEKVVVISGAARGQGEAEARLFVAEGARVLLGDVLDAEGEAVAASLGERAAYAHLDVSSEADWGAAVALALDRFGRIDALVNNAGVMQVAPIASCSKRDFERVLEVNLVGAFLGIRAVMDPMSAGGGGSIVNVSSVSGYASVPGQAAYSASKFGLRGLTKTAAVELGSLGIRVNSIHPGVIETPMIQAPELSDVDWEGIVGNLPLGRSGQPEDIARMALFLCSDEASYSTGAEFLADGGLLASP
ncbi:MAG: glucose 1-dehydrogenase [Myxococcales bacterium]|nr:glucose 1-dehydrogenase [Myxococcales bacterium]